MSFLIVLPYYCCFHWELNRKESSMQWKNSLNPLFSFLLSLFVDFKSVWNIFSTSYLAIRLSAEKWSTSTGRITSLLTAAAVSNGLIILSSFFLISSGKRRKCFHKKIGYFLAYYFSSFSISFFFFPYTRWRSGKIIIAVAAIQARGSARDTAI